MDAADYVAGIRDRMSHNGYDTNTDVRLAGAALVGYRTDFRLSWGATKLHLFVAVKVAEEASRQDLEQFTSAALAAGKQAKGRRRGLQTGVAAIAVLVANHVATDAVEFAENELDRQFAAFAWPVTVDLTTGTRASHLGEPRLGRLYTKWMRLQIETVIPEPTVEIVFP